MNMIVVETVFIIPKSGTTERVHCIRNRNEMFKKLRRNIFVTWVFPRQLQRDRQHCGAIKSHPCGGVGLIEVPAERSVFGAIENADIIQPQKPTGENMIVVSVFSVDPPSKVNQQLVKNSREKLMIGLTILFPNFIYSQRRPSMNGRVDVAKRKLISRNLSAGMHVPFPQK